MTPVLKSWCAEVTLPAKTEQKLNDVALSPTYDGAGKNFRSLFRPHNLLDINDLDEFPKDNIAVRVLVGELLLFAYPLRFQKRLNFVAGFNDHEPFLGEMQKFPNATTPLGWFRFPSDLSVKAKATCKAKSNLAAFQRLRLLNPCPAR